MPLSSPWFGSDMKKAYIHVDVKIKQAVKKLLILVWLDAEKACVHLAPDYDVLNVTNKVGIIKTESS